MMSLLETIDMMVSRDFKKRTTAEYHQLDIRIRKLEAMCEKYAAGELDFTPNCSLELLQEQLGYMKQYRTILEERAEIEGIELEDLCCLNEYCLVLTGPINPDEGDLTYFQAGNSNRIMSAMVTLLGKLMDMSKKEDVTDDAMFAGMGEALQMSVENYRKRKEYENVRGK